MWWGGFLVLTIAGERLDLSRIMGLSEVGRAIFLGVVAVFLAGLALSGVNLGLGTRLAGAGMIALTLWLARHDIARWTVRRAGLPRFIAVCLLSGYVWLGISGALALLVGGVVMGPLYNAMLHSLLLGFIFAMIFGHAPIIFPAVLGVTVYYRPTFYAHLLLLHLTLLLRVAADLADWLPGIQWGGLLNAVALLLFVANTVYATRKTAIPARPTA